VWPKAPTYDSFLIITYTRAAAAELKSRILTELGRLTAADPENRRLSRQAGLCSRAPIGTIHSFCTALLRENAHLLGLAPDFRVADEDRAKTTKAPCWTASGQPLPGPGKTARSAGSSSTPWARARDEQPPVRARGWRSTRCCRATLPEKMGPGTTVALSIGDTADAGKRPGGCYILRTPPRRPLSGAEGFPCCWMC
jgi:hypothetical protein